MLDTPMTKVRRPCPLEGALVSRPRLTDALHRSLAAQDATVLMLSAPAGYGKTALLAQWAGELVGAGILAAWCSIDVDDRDPIVLWNTIRDALVVGAGDEHPGLRDDLQRLVPSMVPREHSAFVARLQSVLEGHGAPIALIADDTHVLEGSPSELEFIRIIRALPPTVMLAFATRTALPAHGARLAGRLLKITADSLSFTRAETSELLAAASSGTPDDAAVARASEVDALYAASEGWPAALSLSLIAVERREGEDAAFGPVDPVLLHDYLQREVFDDVPPDEKRVLLATAVCPLITADLANAINGSTDSGELLRRLALRNRMLRSISVDHRGRTWYRVQPLFREFLAHTLLEGSNRARAGLIARAARWHAVDGDPLVALQLVIDEGDAEIVDEVLRMRGCDLVADGHAPSILALAAPFESRALAGPFSRLMLAHAAVVAGEIERATDIIATTKPLTLGVDDLLEWDWLRYLVELGIARAAGTATTDIDPGWDDSTLLEVPEALRTAVHLERGLSAERRGDTDDGRTELQLSLAIAENHGDLSSQVMSVVGLAAGALMDSNMRLAARLGDRALALSAFATTQDHAAGRTMAHTISGWAAHQLLELPLARAHARDALRASDTLGPGDLREQALQLNAAVNFDTLPDRRRITQDFTTHWPHAFLEGAPASLIVASLHCGLGMASIVGEARWSERLLDRARPLLGDGHDWNVAYALHLTTTGRDASARSVLAPLLRDDRSARTPQSEIIERGLEAIQEYGADNPFRAHAALLRALELADETGLFHEVGRAGWGTISRMLREDIDRFGSREHIARALLEREVSRPSEPSMQLTPRERELLAELRTLRTVEEIARDMLLSVNTVKTHMRGIYRKLDATSRRQAVATAERLGLL